MDLVQLEILAQAFQWFVFKSFVCVCLVFFPPSNRKILTTTQHLPPLPKLQDAGHRKYNLNNEVYSINTEITKGKPALTSLNKCRMFLSSLTF